MQRSWESLGTAFGPGVTPPDHRAAMAVRCAFSRRLGGRQGYPITGPQSRGGVAASGICAAWVSSKACLCRALRIPRPAVGSASARSWVIKPFLVAAAGSQQGRDPRPLPTAKPSEPSRFTVFLRKDLIRACHGAAILSKAPDRRRACRQESQRSVQSLE
jgi:hypothetical protein